MLSVANVGFGAANCLPRLLNVDEIDAVSGAHLPWEAAEASGMGANQTSGSDLGEANPYLTAGQNDQITWDIGEQGSYYVWWNSTRNEWGYCHSNVCA